VRPGLYNLSREGHPVGHALLNLARLRGKALGKLLGSAHVVLDDLRQRAHGSDGDSRAICAVRGLGGCDRCGDEGHTDPDGCGGDNCANRVSHLSLMSLLCRARARLIIVGDDISVCFVFVHDFTE
jgi:hypothetical protein